MAEHVAAHGEVDPEPAALLHARRDPRDGDEPVVGDEGVAVEPTAGAKLGMGPARSGRRRGRRDGVRIRGLGDFRAGPVRIGDVGRLADDAEGRCVLRLPEVAVSLRSLSLDEARYSASYLVPSKTYSSSTSGSLLMP